LKHISTQGYLADLIVEITYNPFQGLKLFTISTV